MPPDVSNLSLSALAEQHDGVRALVEDYARLTRNMKDDEPDDDEEDHTKNLSRADLIKVLKTNAAKVAQYRAAEKTRALNEKNSLVDDLVKTIGADASDYADLDLGTVQLVHKNALKTLDALNDIAAKPGQPGSTPDQGAPATTDPPGHGGETAESGDEDEEKKRRAGSPAAPTQEDPQGAPTGSRALLANRIKTPGTRNRNRETATSVYQRIANNEQKKRSNMEVA